MAEPFTVDLINIVAFFKYMLTLEHLIQLLSPLLDTFILLLPFQAEIPPKSYTTSDQLL